jgi:hypothetical protein
MPDGVLGVFGGEGDDATERFRLLLLETLLVDGRRAEGIAEGKALRFGCAGMDEGVWGERWVAMEKSQANTRLTLEITRIRTKTSQCKYQASKNDLQQQRAILRQRRRLRDVPRVLTTTKKFGGNIVGPWI